MNETTKQMDLDEAVRILTDIARNGEGAERFRALREIRMMAQETETSVLPDPLTDQEVIERIGRLDRAAGTTLSQMAYRWAFPNAKRPIQHAAPKVLTDDIVIDRSTLPVNLKQLYRMFPEIKRPGVPQGYPMGKGLAVVKRWCQDKALQMLVDKEQNRLDVAAISDKEVESVEPTES